MYMLLLTFHIAVAVVTTVASVGAIIAIARQKIVKQSLRAMWGSFGLTAVSGAGLVALQPHLLAHTCVMMSLYVAVTSAVQFYASRNARRLAPLVTEK